MVSDPFKQYKSNPRSLLHLDASPKKLHELVVSADVAAITKLLSGHFDDVARLDFEWLHELLDIGCSFEEMARLLIDGENESPWILLDHRVSITSVPVIEFHQPLCVHSGGQKLDTAPRVLNKQSTQDAGAISIIEDAKVQETVSVLCGVAGALPLASEDYEWTSYVRFTGENSVAWVSYVNDSSSSSNPAFRMEDALQRVYQALGYLQETGICCDTFTILRVSYSNAISQTNLVSTDSSVF